MKQAKLLWLVAGLAAGPALALAQGFVDGAGGAPASKAAPQGRSLPLGSPSPLEAQLEPPADTEQAWLMLHRELSYGKPAIVQRRLDQLLLGLDVTPEKAESLRAEHGPDAVLNPDLTPQLLLELREKYGSSMLVRLGVRPELRKAASKLIAMANEASLAKARDPDRIRRFLANLDQSAHHRAYARDQLRQAGPHAVPFFIEAMTAEPNKRQTWTDGLRAMDRNYWSAVAAALETQDESLLLTMIEVLESYAEPAAIDVLWFPAGSPSVPAPVQQRARQAIERLTGISWNNLPAPASALEGIAQRHYQAIPRASGEGEIWRWSEGTVKSERLPASEAERDRGLAAARKALTLDPARSGAKVLYLSLILDQPAAAPSEEPTDEALQAGPELLTQVLERSLQEGRTRVTLAALVALGRLGTPRLVIDGDQPGPLLLAMEHPSRRVQFAAVLAVLEARPAGPFPQASRVVQALIGALDPQTRSVALILDGDRRRSNHTAAMVAQLGFESRVFATGRDGFRNASDSMAVDLVLLDANVHDWGLEETVANFRADTRTAGVPMVLFADGGTADRQHRLGRRYPAVTTAPRLASPQALARLLALQAEASPDPPLSEEERAAQQRAALAWLLRLARGEAPALDVSAASEALAGLLGSAKHGPSAAAVLAHLPSARNQGYLAAAALDASQPAENRLATCLALARNIRTGGTALDQATIRAILAAFAQSPEPPLRTALAALAGLVAPAATLPTR